MDASCLLGRFELASAIHLSHTCARIAAPFPLTHEAS